MSRPDPNHSAETLNSSMAERLRRHDVALQTMQALRAAVIERDGKLADILHLQSNASSRHKRFRNAIMNGWTNNAPDFAVRLLFINVNNYVQATLNTIALGSTSGNASLLIRNSRHPSCSCERVLGNTPLRADNRY